MADTNKDRDRLFVLMYRDVPEAYEGEEADLSTRIERADVIAKKEAHESLKKDLDF